MGWQIRPLPRLLCVCRGLVCCRQLLRPPRTLRAAPRGKMGAVPGYALPQVLGDPWQTEYSSGRSLILGTGPIFAMPERLHASGSSGSRRRPVNTCPTWVHGRTGVGRHPAFALPDPFGHWTMLTVPWPWPTAGAANFSTSPQGRFTAPPSGTRSRKGNRPPPSEQGLRVLMITASAGMGGHW